MTKPTPLLWFYNFMPVLVWFLLLVLPFINAPDNIPDEMRQRYITNIVISNILLLVLFYIHTYVLYPLLQKRGWIIYLLSLCASLLCYWIYWWFFREPLAMGSPNEFSPPMGNRWSALKGHNAGRRPPFGPPLGVGPVAFMHVLPPAIALLCSYCYRIILDNNKRLEFIKERETVHLRTELSFLRSQINPHFLFNILNNLTSLARKRSVLLEPAIVNLSQLMRYMIYESDDNRAPLSKEVEYLRSYIELQLLRFGKEVTVKIEMEGDYSSFFIGPMLLISLVENAFKYGTGASDQTIIFITLKVSNQHQLQFCVINDIVRPEQPCDENTGIGLKNLKRRLDILYPHRHRLKAVSNGMIFTAELAIDLD